MVTSPFARLDPLSPSRDEAVEAREFRIVEPDIPAPGVGGEFGFRVTDRGHLLLAHRVHGQPSIGFLHALRARRERLLPTKQNITRSPAPAGLPGAGRSRAPDQRQGAGPEAPRVVVSSQNHFMGIAHRCVLLSWLRWIRLPSSPHRPHSVPPKLPRRHWPPATR